MLYELFMFWVVGSISVVVASMVLGGLLCVWLGCCRFQRHRVRCINEPGGAPWIDASLRESLSWRR